MEENDRYEKMDAKFRRRNKEESTKQFPTFQNDSITEDLNENYDPYNQQECIVRMMNKHHRSFIYP